MLTRVIVGSAIAATSWYAFYRVMRWWRTWGRDAREAAMALPGDDLVPEPTMTDTRGITIEATPAAVWPWIVQLGYGRGGWYSYDVVDMKGRSAEEILPQFQSLAPGELVPTDPGGGFEVRVVDPERALVLMIDDQVAARRDPSARAADAETPGLEVSSKFMQASMPPEFAVSWAIVLQPVGGGRTRLIERIRGSFGAATPGSRALGPALGLGIFLMTRRQLLGIKARVERWPAVPAQGDAAPAPVAAGPGTLPA